MNNPRNSEPEGHEDLGSALHGSANGEGPGSASAPVAPQFSVESSAELMRICAASARVAVWALDPVTRGSWWSDLVYDLLLFDKNETRTNSFTFRDLMHPEDKEDAIQAMERFLAGEVPVYRAIFRLKRGDGKWCWFESTGRMGQTQNGQPVICGGLKDIDTARNYELERDILLERSTSAQREAQKALSDAEAARSEAKASEDMLRLAVAFGKQAAWSTCVETNEAWMMEEGYHVLGYTPEEFVPNAEGWQSIIHPDDLEASLVRVNAHVAGETETFDHVQRLRHKDGSYHWYRVMSRLQDRTDQGLPPLLAGMIINVDDLKANETRLFEALELAETLRQEAKSNEEMLRVSVSSGEQTAWSVCEETGEAWLMDEGYRMMGYEPGDFVPNSAGWRSLIHPDDQAGSVEAMTALVSGEAETYDDQRRYRHQDGSYHWYRVLARLIDRSDQNLPPLVAGTTMRIDAIKEQQKRLSDALELAETLRTEAKSSEEMLRISLAAGQQLAWSICGETGEAWLAKEGYEILGYSQDEFVPDDAGWRNIMHPDDLAKGIEAMERLITQETDTYKCELRLRYKDGTFHWYRALARLIDRSALGLPPLVAGTTTCIDGEKERELRLSEALAEAEKARSAAQQSADILRVSSENSGVVPWFRVPDTDEFWFSQNIVDFLGLPSGTQVSLEDWMSRIHPDDLPTVGEAIEAVETGRTDTFDVELRCRHENGGFLWCRSVGRRISRREKGLPDLICGAQFSIDELKQAEIRQAEVASALMAANERMTSIADNAPAGIFEYRRFADGRFDFPYASARFCDLFGVEPTDMSETPERPFQRIHEDDLPKMKSSIDASEERMENWTLRFRAEHPTRGPRWLLGSSTPKANEDGSISWIGVVTDVTEDANREIALKNAHRLAEQMRVENEHLALHDPLTGLPNRRFFDQLFQSRLDTAASGGKKDLCLVRVDLDKFKYINDTLGHDAGDLALEHVARVMKDCVRDTDFVARIGGDEFSILLSEGSNEQAAERLVTRLRTHLEEPLAIGPRKFHVRASFGVAYAIDILDYGRDLQFFADKALYTAKQSGRNQLQFFTSDIHRGILDDRELGVDLQEALLNDQFVPYFQPQVSAVSGALTGIETLLRWDHPTRGVLTPDKFMPLAEQMRIMPEIDRLTFRKALELVRDWELEGLRIPKVSFNISSGRMRDPAILRDTENWQSGLNAQVTFELLESIVIENESAEFNANLAEVRSRGIDIEIDDFGSGHASIISIIAIAPSALKIDRRLVQPIGQDAKYLDVVRGIISIANALGVTTIAEGVETEETAREITELGCEVLQGYLFARPLSPDDMRAYIQNGSSVDRVASSTEASRLVR